MLKKVLKYNRTSFLVSFVMMILSVVMLITGDETPTGVAYITALLVANVHIGILEAELHTKV